MQQLVLRTVFAGLIVCSTLASVVFGQQAEDALPVAAAPVVYNNPEYDSLAVVEFPFSLNRARLQFYRPDSSDSGFYGRVFAEVTLFDSLAQPYKTANTYFSVRVDDPKVAETTSVMLFNKLGLVAAPGRYSARLTVIDAVSKRTADYFFPNVTIDPPQRERLQLSGAVLAYSASYMSDSAQAATERMARSGFMVLVNPSGVFTTSDSTITLFAELYNLRETAEVKPKYRLAFRITDTTGETVQDFGYVDRPKPGRSAVISESFNLAGWLPGWYRFVVIATDPATAHSDSVVLPLGVITPRHLYARVDGESVSDPYDSLTLEDKVRVAHYLLSPDQRTTVSRLTDEGKANFLTQFWREYEDTPGRPSTESRAEMVRRYVYANQYFSRLEGKRDGWSSDRGRIYMTYGHWDQRDDVPAPREGNPFSIWYYRTIKEGKHFVFEDDEGDNDYKLIHSNVPGERYDETWAGKVREEMLDIR